MPTEGRVFTEEYKRNRKKLLEENDRCWMNPAHLATEADHRIAWSKWLDTHDSMDGVDDMENLLPICKPCNSRRGNKEILRSTWWDESQLAQLQTHLN